MIYLNAGNLWDKEYLDTVIQWNEEFKDTIRVQSLFGSIAKLTPTARAADRLPYLEWSAIDRFVDTAQQNNINIRYTLNQSCIGSLQDFHHDWTAKLRSDIKELHSVGVREWTVTSPLLVDLLRGMFPTDFIEVSTIAELSTAEDAERWMELGANGVNLATSINRDFRAIEDIIKTGIKVSILANEACLFRCPWRRDCYNLSSHNSIRSDEFFQSYPFQRCNQMRIDEPVEWVKSRLLLPQWMKFYQDHVKVDWFKVAYRTHPKEVALPILRYYMEQDYHGDLLELWPTIAHLGHTDEPKDRSFISVDSLEEQNFLLHFMNYGDRCRSSCEDCGYCQMVYETTQEAKTK